MNLWRSSLNSELESKGWAPLGYAGATCGSHMSDTAGCSCPATKALVSLWQLWPQVLVLRGREGWGPEGPTAQSWEAAKSVPPPNAPNIVQGRTRHWETSHPLNQEFRFISLFLSFQQDTTMRTFPPPHQEIWIYSPFSTFPSILQGISMSFPAAFHSVRLADSVAGQLGSSFPLEKK